MSGLFIVGTPIGNLGDMPPRALETLRAVDAVLAEDTRRTRALLSAFNISKPLFSCHAFNEAKMLDGIIGRLRAGEKIALVTDSGMPAVSDPGARVIRACRNVDIPVRVLPGPSAVTAAIAAAGCGGHGYVFLGFAPRKPGKRRRCFQAWADCALPLVFFESPHRLLQFLADAGECWGERRLYVCRELTKKFEEHYRGTASELTLHFKQQTIRGEFVVVVEGASPTYAEK